MKRPRFRNPWTRQTRGILFSSSSRQTELWKRVASLQLQTGSLSVLFATCCSIVDTRVSSPPKTDVRLRPIASVLQNLDKFIQCLEGAGTALTSWGHPGMALHFFTLNPRGDITEHRSVYSPASIRQKEGSDGCNAIDVR